MTTAKDTGPLAWNVPIVDVRSGRPSPEFQRRWEQQRKNNALIGTITFGSGAPTGTPEDGAEYIDTSVTPYVFYIGSGKVWHQVGVKFFDDLQDVNIPTVAQGDVLYRNATEWVVLTPGTNGKVLTTHGGGANPTWESAGDLGFGFNATGLLSAGETLGAGIIPHDTTFDQTNALTEIICAIPPTSAVDLPIWTTDSSNLLYSPGHIHVAAGATLGSLVLSPNPWLYIGRHPIYLYAPTPADPTFSEVMGFIVGTST